MLITKIEQQKNNTQRYSVFIDGEFSFGLDGTDILYYKLTEGKEISVDEYNNIVNENIFIKARDMAVKFLSYRARSRKEVVNKLAENEFSQEIINRVLDQMEKYNYVNDEEFCRMFIRDKKNLNGLGNDRITYELKLKGIEPDIIEKCLSDTEFDEYETAYKVLCKKYKNGFVKQEDINNTLFYKEKKKAVDFLIRKGYSYEVATYALERIMEY